MYVFIPEQNQTVWHKQSFYLKKSELLCTVRKKTWDRSWNILSSFQVHLIRSCYKEQENPHTVRAFLYNIQQRTNINILHHRHQFSHRQCLSDIKPKPVGLIADNSDIEYWSQTQSKWVLSHCVCVSMSSCYIILQLKIQCFLLTKDRPLLDNSGNWHMTLHLMNWSVQSTPNMWRESWIPHTQLSDRGILSE